LRQLRHGTRVPLRARDGRWERQLGGWVGTATGWAGGNGDWGGGWGRHPRLGGHGTGWGATRLARMLLSMSTLCVRTLREDPADAEVPSHRLLVRAGYIRRAAPGIYTWLPLGLRVLGKVEDVVRQEMAAAGAQEVHFPALLP